MRIVMVGGGVIGLLTAVECVTAGHEVALLDQVGVPFSGATSFDHSRVLRALHLDNPTAASAAVLSHHLWIALQELLSVRLYHRTGALTAVAAEDLPRATAMLTAAGSTARVLDADELAASYPQMRFAPGMSAVLESHAGVLLANRILGACAEWLRRHPSAELYPHHRAVGVDVPNAAVRLADGGLLRADAVLLAAGPWSRALLPPSLAADLVLRRQSMIYCAVPAAQATTWSVTPAITSLGTAGGAWLVPPVGGAPLKLSAASACRVVAGIDGNTTPPHWRDHLAGQFTTLLPGFRAEWVVDSRDCYYLSHVRTGGPMLAVLGERVLSYAACGGSSFKFAPLIARCLADRLTGTDPVPTGLAALDDPIHHRSPEPTTNHRQVRTVLRGVS